MTCRCGHTFCYICGDVTINYVCATCHEKSIKLLNKL